MTISKCFSLQKLPPFFSKYRKRIALSVITLIIIGLFAYLAFFSNILRTRAAGDGLVHIEPEKAATNSRILSESGASGGKFIRFIKAAVPSPTKPAATNTTSPSRPPTATPTRGATSTPRPTGPTATLPPIQAGKGIWISKEEIMRLDNSGGAWDKVVADANKTGETAKLNQNNSEHDVYTLAKALVAVRNNDNEMRKETLKGINSAMGSSLSSTLELGRGLQTYIIAADIIGLNESETPKKSVFQKWIRETINRTDIKGREGKGLCNNAEKDSSNWGGHERASCIAAALYLNDTTLLNKMVRAHKEFIGEDVSPKMFSYNSPLTNWHGESRNPAGVNRKGAVINGTNVSGVLPEDWRRASSFSWPPPYLDEDGNEKSGVNYRWEGMQGFVVSAVMLHRAGVVPFYAGDNAVVRSVNMLYGKGEAAQNNPVFIQPAGADDQWILYLVNYYAGTSYPTEASKPGKNMGYTDWTHAGNVQGAADSQVLAETSCPQVTPGMSSATMSMSTQSGVYKVWSRMRASSTGGNAYWLKVDDRCPVLVGDSTSLPRTWTWVNYTSGNTGSAYSVQLTEGTHTFTLYGAEEGVDLDKVLLTQNITCTPQEYGTNCAILDRVQSLVIESESGSRNGATEQSDSSASGGKYVLFGQPPQPTSIPATATRAPTSGATSTPRPTGPLPTSAPVKGIWTSPQELASKPTSGPAWDALLAEANGLKLDKTGNLTKNPDPDNQDDPVNVQVLANAIVYARSKDASKLAVVTEALQYIEKVYEPKGCNYKSGDDFCNNARTLAWGREIGAYALAADLVGYRSKDFEDKMRHMAEWYRGHQVEKSLLDMYKQRPNNWGAMAFGSLTAIYRYLGDTAKLSEVRNYMIQSINGPKPTEAVYKDPCWQADEKDLRWINPKGATNKCPTSPGDPLYVSSGEVNVDGIIPDDMRRNTKPCACSGNPPQNTDYHWEGMQGLVMGARILERAGMPIWDTGDRALCRAAAMLQDTLGGDFTAKDDDRWQIPFLDRACGKNWTGDDLGYWSSGKNAGFGYVLP